MAGSLLGRLAKVEAAARIRQQEEAANDPGWDDIEWCAWYEVQGERGEFDHEPDFKKALAMYRDALLATDDPASPPYAVPADFEPRETPWYRVRHWRSAERFPAIHQAREWLGEMHQRLHDGTPPVSEVEYGELVAWLHANYDRLRAVDPNTLLEVGDGKRDSLLNLLTFAKPGPRAYGAGKMAVILRYVRDRYPE